MTTSFKRLSLFNLLQFYIFYVKMSLESGLDFRQKLQICSAAYTPTKTCSKENASDVEAAGT
jgi:hypothetical protein